MAFFQIDQKIQLFYDVTFKITEHMLKLCSVFIYFHAIISGFDAFPRMCTPVVVAIIVLLNYVLE